MIMKLHQSTISILLLLLVVLTPQEVFASNIRRRVVQTEAPTDIVTEVTTEASFATEVPSALVSGEDSTESFAGREEDVSNGFETSDETETEEGPTLFQMAQSFMITTYNVAVNGLTGVARIVGVVADIAGSVGAIGDVLGGRDA